jgi:hypothetical protein
VGEVLGWIGLVLVMSAAGTGAVLYFNRLFRKPEPLAIRSGQDATAVSYRFARRAVRMLERLVERDNLVPFLSTDDRKEIDDIIRGFDEL